MTNAGLLTLAARHPDSPAVEIRVNFGIFAGRLATPAELDDLAHALLPAVGEVSIVSEQRREVSSASEAALHQVRVEIAAQDMPEDEAEIERLIGRLLQETERWAQGCIDDRHAEIADA